MEINKPNFGDRKGSANPNILDFTFPNDNRNRNFKQKMVRSLESNEGSEREQHEYMRMHKKGNVRLYNKPGYPQNSSNQMSEFHSIEHAPHYSSSSRGGVAVDKTNCSMSPNHTKVPSNNSGYNTNEVDWSHKGSTTVNNSSRNARNMGKIEHLHTDPIVFNHESQNSRNKYSNRMMANQYNDQRNTYDTGRQFMMKGNNPPAGIGFKGHQKDPDMSSTSMRNTKKIAMHNSQRSQQTSDADEARKHMQHINYDSPNSGSGEHHPYPQQKLQQNYRKFADRNYKSGGGGSGSTSGGGTSIEGMHQIQSQYYPRSKLNVSDMTDQSHMHSMQDDKDTGFYSVGTNNLRMQVNRRGTGNRNSRDQQFMNSDSRKMSDFQFEEQKFSTQTQIDRQKNLQLQKPRHNSDLSFSQNLYELIQMMDELNRETDELNQNSTTNLANSSFSMNEQASGHLEPEQVQRIQGYLTRVLELMAGSEGKCTLGYLKQGVKRRDLFDIENSRSYFIENEGLGLLLKLLDTSASSRENDSIALIVLKIINNITDWKNTGSQNNHERICLAGFLQYILMYGSPDYDTALRVEVAYFFGIPFLNCQTKNNDIDICTQRIIQMMVAAGGVPVLVNFIDEEYENNIDIIMITMDCLTMLIDYE